ncbi:MAG: hypothetical protein RL084_820 [Pseudomonadota bacterium]|jgi:hypothetical protein
MRSMTFKALILMMCLLGMAVGHAQTPSTANGSGKKEAKTKPATPPSSNKTVKKHEPLKAVAAGAAVEPALAQQELTIAERVHVGNLPCELGASVRMTADANAPGYFNLQGKGYKYRMRPVTTSTGAIRLEDEKAGAVWLQLANKSMLMDQKNGRRLADECAHPDQVAVANDMKVNPPPALIDVSNTAAPVQR